MCSRVRIPFPALYFKKWVDTLKMNPYEQIQIIRKGNISCYSYKGFSLVSVWGSSLNLETIQKVKDNNYLIGKIKVEKPGLNSLRILSISPFTDFQLQSAAIGADIQSIAYNESNPIVNMERFLQNISFNEHKKIPPEIEAENLEDIIDFGENIRPLCLEIARSRSSSPEKAFAAITWGLFLQDNNDVSFEESKRLAINAYLNKGNEA